MVGAKRIKFKLFQLDPANRTRCILLKVIISTGQLSATVALNIKKAIFIL
jgi:hypothetical protein